MPKGSHFCGFITEVRVSSHHFSNADIEAEIAAVRAVTAAEVRAVAREMFRPENRCVSWVVPQR